MANVDITTAAGQKALSEAQGWVDVRGYGCIGDSDGTTGSGTDDLTNMQLALDSLEASGGILYIPRNKIFRLSDTIHYLGSGPLIITGGGTLYFDTITFAGYDSYTVGFVIEADLTNATGDMSGTTTLNRTGTIGKRLVIRDVKLLSNGSKTGTYSSAHHCMQIICFDDVTIHNCHFEGFNGAAIEMYGTDRVRIDNNTFKNIRQNGVGGSGCKNILVSHNHFFDVGEPVQLSGPYIEVTNNVMSSVGGPLIVANAMSAIHIGASSFNEAIRASIHGNIIDLDPTYDGVQSSGIKIADEGTHTTDSHIDYVSVKNNTIKGGFSCGISVTSPPSPTGSIVVSENHIIRSSTSAVVQSAIYVYYEANGYGGNEWVEVYNNEIVHVDGNDDVSIDVAGAALTLPPRTKVIGNKITTMATLAAETNDPQKIGGIIYVPSTNPGYCVYRNNYVNGARVGKRAVMGVAGAGVADGTTVGKAKTTNAVTIMSDRYMYTKAGTDDLFDLTSVSTTGTQYCKVLLCMDIVSGAGHILVGEKVAAQAFARIPQIGIDNSWVPVGVVELGVSYAGGDLAGCTFYDIIGEWDY